LYFFIYLYVAPAQWLHLLRIPFLRLDYFGGGVNYTDERLLRLLVSRFLRLLFVTSDALSTVACTSVFLFADGALAERLCEVFIKVLFTLSFLAFRLR
jgi:hypothetical protein